MEINWVRQQEHEIDWADLHAAGRWDVRGRNFRRGEGNYCVSWTACSTLVAELCLVLCLVWRAILRVCIRQAGKLRGPQGG